MKIYKFKDLSDEKKHSHFLQIVLRKSIWCAKPESLNDENEFIFQLDYTPSPRTADLLTEVVRNYRTSNFTPPVISVASVLQNNQLKNIMSPIIEDLKDDMRNKIGIISFSSTKDDNHLWTEYGGSGNGVCVEIELPDKFINDSYHPVHYVTEKIFHVDSFLESAIFPHKAFETYRNILLTKTKKWSQEEEIRFISKRQEVNVIIDGQITEITFGSHVPAQTITYIESTIAEHCLANGIRITRL